LNGWVLNPHDDKWETGYLALKNYLEENGDCLVIKDHITKDGYRLGRWVSHQRSQRETLSLDRKYKLESLKGWVWNIHKKVKADKML
jgi:hypothetical protein